MSVDRQGRNVATDLETFQRFRRDENYNGRTATWDDPLTGETKCYEDWRGQLYCD